MEFSRPRNIKVLLQLMRVESFVKEAFMKWRFWKHAAVKEPPAQPVPRISLALVAAIRECEKDNTEDITKNKKGTDDSSSDESLPKHTQTLTIASE